MVHKPTMEYEDKQIYKGLLEAAHRQGYDTFAVVFINQYEHKIVKPARMPAIEAQQLNEVMDGL